MSVSEKVAKRQNADKALDELRAELMRSGDETLIRCPISCSIF